MKVKVINKNNTYSIKDEESLLDVLRREKVSIRSSCGGYASCGDCVVKVREGSENLEKPNFDEKKLLGNVFHITKERLACQMKTCINPDETIEVEIVNLD